MLIASFDIGLINMSLCILDTDEKIQHWSVFSIKSKSAEGSCKKLFECLDDLKILNDASTVVIERQPRMNPKARVIEAYVLSYFTMRNADFNLERKIVKYSPKFKLRIYKGTIPDFKVKSAYSIRKKTSIFITDQMIQTQDDKYKKIFKECKKKDDLADAYCMGIAFIRFMINKSTYYPPPEPVKIIRDVDTDSETELFED
jgi:hypothetical protein